MDLDVAQCVVAHYVMPCNMGEEGSSIRVRRRETADIFISVQKRNLTNLKFRLMVFLITTWGLSFSGFKFTLPPSYFFGNNPENLKLQQPFLVEDIPS